MQAGRRIKHQVAGRQLHLVHAVFVLNRQFATVVFLRLRQKQGDRQVRANADRAPRYGSNRPVDMGPEMLTDAVAIEQRWNYFM
jgi:hypothetical protein